VSSESIEDLRRLIAVLATRLLEYAGDDAEAMPPLEGDEGRLVVVHAARCGGSCDYGCGAVSIMSSTEDGETAIENVACGLIQVRGLGGLS
jgi:hypothetical protein